MGTENVTMIKLDVREIVPAERHATVFRMFGELEEGGELHVFVDHDPMHLLQHMKHEGLPVDADAYRISISEDGLYEAVFKKLPDKELPDGSVFTSFDQERSYSDDRFNPISVFRGDNYKVILTYIKKGQFIPVHSPSTDLIFMVYKGEGVAVLGSKQRGIKPGDLVMVRGGSGRGIKANTDLEGLHVVSPIPDENDHQEVVKKLAENRFI